MKKYSKRIKILQNSISKSIYTFDESILLLKKFGTAKFLETVEAHIHLNIDPKFLNQQLRTNLILPHGIGKNLKIVVFAEKDEISETSKNVVSLVGIDAVIDIIKSEKLNFDILITTIKLMPNLTKFSRILGPKGLMPSPKLGTVTQNLDETISEFNKGKLEYKVDKTGIVHLNFGKCNFSEKQLKENLIAIYNSIERNKPYGVKGRFFKSFKICTTMSPSINIDLNTIKNII